MRTVLRALSLVFAVGVVAMLTSNASREDSGCSAQSNGKSQAGSPQAVKPTPPPSVQPAPPPAPPPALEPVAPEPKIPIRFMGASKAAPVFIPPPPAKKTPDPVPQQAK